MACGPARTWRPCCGWRRATARRWRCRPAGSACRRSSLQDGGPSRSAGTRRRGQSAEHRGALRPVERPLPAVPRRDDDLLERGVRDAGPDLADAQRNKYRIVAAKARLERGQHVLEIGTGWGGFALYAAGELGCRVTSVTISREQYELARERVRRAGLGHLVDIQLRDYRDIEGTYDAIVSIEMLEAVGRGVLRHVLRGVRPGLATRAAG